MHGNSLNIFAAPRLTSLRTDKFTSICFFSERPIEFSQAKPLRLEERSIEATAKINVKNRRLR